MTLKTSSSLLFLVFFQIFSVKAQYCTPSPTTTAEGEITNVVLMGATYGISNFTTCPTVAAFENYTSVDSANVIQGSSYTATITISPCGGFALDPGACEAWIDWNQNGVYNTNESIGSWTGNIYSSNKTATFNFTVPVSASVGRTRLRILLRQGYGAANTPPLNPCTGGFTYGAVEDYTIQVQAVPSPCPGPTSPSVGVVSDSSAVIYWNSTQSSFDVEYGLAGFTPGSGTSQIVFNDTLFLASLTAQTNYQYYVRSNCTSTGNGTSAWLGPIPFTTACVVQSMPYLQTFSSWPVPCFDTIGGTFSFKRDSISSSAVAYMDGRANSDNAILISPAILISTDAQLEFTWSHHKVTWANDKLLVSMREIGTQTWDVIWQKSGTNLHSPGGGQFVHGNFIPELVNIKSVYLNKNVEFKIEAQSGGYGSNIYVDDFEVSAQAPCAQITSVSFTNIQATTADVNFVVAGNEFLVEWGPTGFQQGTGTLDTTTGSPFTLYGLSFNNTYDVYLRRVCFGVFTTWVGPFTFTTSCGDYPANFFTNFDADITGFNAVCWSLIGTQGSANALIYTPQSSQNIQAVTAPNFLQYNAWVSSNLISPHFSSIDQNTKQVRFMARKAFGTVNSSMVYVGTMSDPTNDSTFISVDTLLLNDAWQSYTVVLSGVPTGHSYVSFRLNPTFGSPNIGIDDFYLEDQPSCLPPSNFKAKNITANTTTLTWSTAGANTWDVEYGLAGFTQGNGTKILGLTTNSASLSTLLPNTVYEVYIYSYCTSGSNSEGPLSFKTLCTPVAIPNTQMFTTWPVACWNASQELKSWISYADTSSKMAQATMQYWTGGERASLRTEGYLINQPATVRFKWSHLSALDSLYFLMRIQPSDQWDTIKSWGGAAFHSPIATPNPVKTKPHVMVDEVFNLDSASTVNQTVEFKLLAIASNQGASVFVDDFIVMPMPLCADPFNFSVNSVTGFSAIAGWQGSGNFDIEYGPMGFGQGSGVMDSSTTNTYQFLGLAPTTCYDYYVRGNCAANGTSAWIGPLAFCTDYSCPKPSALQLEDAGLTEAWVSWKTGSANHWNMAVGTSAALSAATITHGLTSDSIQINNLNPASVYYVWVQDSCGANDLSFWTGPLVFSTDCHAFGLNYFENFNNWLPGNLPTCWDFNLGEKPWATAAFAGGQLAAFNCKLYPNRESGQLKSTEIFVSDTAIVHYKWSHMLDVNKPNDSLFVLSRIVGSSTWDTLKVYAHSNFNVANATAGLPAPVLAHDSISLTSNYIGEFVEFSFYAVSGNGASIFVDDFAVEVDPLKVTCLPPASLLVSSITPSSASVSWTSTGSSWQIAYGNNLQNPNLGTKVSVAAVPHALSGLASGEFYSVFVREICSPGDTSAWSFAANFSTSCQTFAMPYVDDFSAWTNFANLPCWKLNGGVKQFEPYTQTGANAIHAMADINQDWNPGNALLTMPTVTISIPAMLVMKWSKYYNSAHNDKLYVVSRPIGATTWDTLATMTGANFDCSCTPSIYPNQPGVFVADSFSLPLSYVGQQVECAFYVEGDGGANFFIEEVSIEQDPANSCLSSNALIADTVNCGSAMVSWVSNSATLKNNLVWGPQGFDPAAAGTWLMNATSPQLITGMVGGAAYDVYLQDSCVLGLSGLTLLPLTTPTSPKPTLYINHSINAAGATSRSVYFDGLSTTNATSFTWYFGDGDSSNLAAVVHDYLANGTYTVILVAQNDCGISDTTFTVTIQGIDIEELLSAASVSVYPNPSNGEFVVALPAYKTNAIVVNVLDMLGCVVESFTAKPTDGLIKLNLSNAKNAVYFVQIIDEGQQIVKRVVIQR